MRVCRRQLLRMVVVAATAVGYVELRQWVAVQQLVNIYRKVRGASEVGARQGAGGCHANLAAIARQLHTSSSSMNFGGNGLPKCRSRLLQGVTFPRPFTCVALPGVCR